MHGLVSTWSAHTHVDISIYIAFLCFNFNVVAIEGEAPLHLYINDVYKVCFVGECGQV